MMDRKSLAAAPGAGIPESEVERFAAALESLERVLAPLFAELPIEAEPAAVFHAAPEEGK